MEARFDPQGIRERLLARRQQKKSMTVRLLADENFNGAINLIGAIQPRGLATTGEVELQLIFDTERDHYQLVHAGWHQHRRKYGCLIHMDIKAGKIWIQHDGTERGVANELVELGVPKEHIVLAYQPPYKRPYTAFAVA